MSGGSRSSAPARRRPCRDGQLPGQGAHARRAARRRAQGAVADSRARTASTCTRSTASSAARASTATRSARSTSPAGSTGRRRSASASTSTRRSSRTRRPPTTSRCRIADQGDPDVLDRPRHRLPPHRRRDGQGARHAVRHQPLDPRRHEGHAGRSRRPARAADRVARRRSSRSRSSPRSTSTRSKASCSASAARASPSARTSSTSATRCRAEKLLTLDTGHYHPTETDHRQDQRGVHVPARDPAARQPRRPLGQRSRRAAQRRPRGDRPGAGARQLPRSRRTSASTSSTPASTASPRGSSARAT